MSEDFVRVREEKKFSNPYVRFRRIKGRIVPIVGKKKIGDIISNKGKKMMKAGVAIGATTVLVKKTKLDKGIAKGINKIKEKASKFKIKNPHSKALVLYKEPSRKRKALRKVGKIVKSAPKTLFRHSGKIGAGLILGGAATHLFGTKMQMDSPFGADI